MKRESSSKWQWFLPMVRLQPLPSFFLRLINKFVWIANTLFGILFSKLSIRGARVIGKSSLGNFVLEFNTDCPIGKKGESIVIPKDLVIFESVRSRGVWEPQIVKFLAEPLTLTKIDALEKEFIFLDIGANSGMIARQLALIAQKNFSIICVEPLKQNFEALEYNLASLNRISNLRIFSFALGEKDCLAKIYTEKANIGNTSLLKMHSKNVTQTMVPQKSTSKFIEENLQDYNRIILKCDTQGFETIILSQFPQNFWQNIERGVIEVRSLPNIDIYRVDLILDFLAKFTTMFIIADDARHPIEISELRRFWISESNDEIDLCFSR